jgi:hypothetical protein
MTAKYYLAGHKTKGFGNFDAESHFYFCNPTITIDFHDIRNFQPLQPWQPTSTQSTSPSQVKSNSTTCLLALASTSTLVTSSVRCTGTALVTSSSTWMSTRSRPCTCKRQLQWTLFSKRLADGVIAARHFAQYQVNRGQVPWTPATYAIGTPAESARMQNQWLECSRLVAQLSSAPPTLVIAPFTDMLQFPAFKVNTAAACATTCSIDTGVCFGYLLRPTGAVTVQARAAIYENIEATYTYNHT